MKIFILFLIFTFISLTGISQVTGIDFTKAYNNKEIAFTKISRNQKVFYKENDSTYIYCFPHSEDGLFECIEKASELCDLNSKDFSDPDSDDGYIPDGYELDNFSHIYINIKAGRILFEKGWNFGTDYIVFRANDTIICLEISNKAKTVYGFKL